MSISFRDLITAYSVVDLNFLNPQERALAIYLNVLVYLKTKHWNWLSKLVHELNNIPSNLLVKGNEIATDLRVSQESYYNRHLTNNLLLGYIPDSSEDYYGSVLISENMRKQVLYFDHVSQEILNNPAWSPTLFEAFMKLNANSHFQNSIDLNPYLIVTRN